MIQLLIYLPFLALPLFGLGRGLAAQLALAALGWVVLALGQGALTSGILDGFISAVVSRWNGASRHTYYVVSHFHYALGMAAVLGLLALMARAQRVRNRAATVAFWAMHASIALTILPQAASGSMMSPAADPFELARRLETLNLVSTAATVTGFISFVCLLAMLLFGLLRHLARR